MEVVGARYRLEAELGTGGTATVWRAHDVLMDRTCAVKLLLPMDSGGESRRERLRAEARALAALDHPNVVRVFDLGQADGRDYIVMEYLEAGSLAERLSRTGPLLPKEAVRCVIEVLDALDAAHDAGIVHRDVKPGNVLLRANGKVALCDFGIARGEDLSGDTRTGVALGSLGYMAPEQRIDAKSVGPQADLYAAACTLFNVLTGDTPVDLYLAPDTSPRWDRIPAPLRPVLRRATRSEASARFQSAAEMAGALRDVLPAIEAMPAAPARQRETAGYVPTREGPGVEPTLRAEDRDRRVGYEDYAWSGRRTNVGRSAVWTGVIMVLIAAGAFGLMGPLSGWLERPPAEGVAPAPSEAAVPIVLPPGQLSGRWTGTFGGSPATALLRGSTDALDGEIEIHSGGLHVRQRVKGRWNLVTGELELHEVTGVRPARYRGVFNTAGALVGGMTRPGDPDEVAFTLVRVQE